MFDDASIVFLLDDEPGVVAALERILRVNGFAVRAWTSPIEFLNVHDVQTPGCLVMDLRMPEMSGLEVQRVLQTRGTERPVIFITGQGDVRTTVLGMKAGAVTVLTKPVSAAELIAAVREAIATDAVRRAHRGEQADISARLARLTRRERQVLSLLTTGLMNKQIAAELGAAVKTIKVHRRRILLKMRVRNANALWDLLYRMESNGHQVAWGLRGATDMWLSRTPARGGRLAEISPAAQPPPVLCVTAGRNLGSRLGRVARQDFPAEPTRIAAVRSALLTQARAVPAASRIKPVITSG